MDFLRGTRTRFVKWALVNAVYAIVMAGAGLSYHGQIATPGKIAIGLIIALFAVASGYVGYYAWSNRPFNHDHMNLAIRLCPIVALLGTTSGFLIALSGGAGDVQQRVAGAATGLSATFIGLMSMAVLMLIVHFLGYASDDPGS